MQSTSTKNNIALERLLWRWHFWAGLLCLPVILTLSLSGGIYLFKTEYQQWHDQALLNNAEPSHSTALNLQTVVEQLLTAKPEALFKKLQISQADNPIVQIELEEGQHRKLYWINRDTAAVLKEDIKGQQLMLWLKNLHGELHAGKMGSYVVELAAQWCIVLILCGLCLSYLRERKRNKSGLTTLLRLFFPQRSKSNFWPRHWHQILGSWFALAILLLLISGLPWTQLWGSGFKELQKLAGWNSPGQEWRITLKSKDQQALIDNSLWQINNKDEPANPLQSTSSARHKDIGLETVLQKMDRENWSYPVTIQPPNNPNGVWSVRDMHSDRSLRKTVHFDRWSGDELMRIEFQHYHPVKQVASYGIAMHEGALFGRLNQILGAITALGLVALSLFGFISWWKRRPQTHSLLSGNRLPLGPRLMIGLLSLMLFLPLFGASLILIYILDSALSVFSTSKTKAISRTQPLPKTDHFMDSD